MLDLLHILQLTMTSAAFLARALVVDPQDQGIAELRLRDHLSAVLLLHRLETAAARSSRWRFEPARHSLLRGVLAVDSNPSSRTHGR